MLEQELQSWLVATVAGYLSVDPTEIASDAKLRSYGLDSVHAIALCVDIEECWGLLVEPTLAWDYPTIDALTAVLLTLLDEDN